MHSGDKDSPIVYFTLLVGEYCSHMMIKRTLEHVHHNVLMCVVEARLFLGFSRISIRYLGYV